MPAVSATTSAPPLVISFILFTASILLELIVISAPSFRAKSNFASSISTAKTVEAPEILAYCKVNCPIAPHPMITTVSPGRIFTFSKAWYPIVAGSIPAADTKSRLSY